MKPKISIITVCYNSSAHIEEAIKSVIGQTYDNIEYIVIDGGSTDGTVDIINKYKENINYFVSEPDKGISDAFNKGIVASTGDMIGIVNSDDMLYDCEVLAKVATYYSPDIDLYRGKEIVRNFETGYEYTLNPTMTIKCNPLSFCVCHMATFISREAIQKYGMYDVDFHYSMDKDLIYRYMYNGAKSIEMDVIVGIFRPGGVSHNYCKNKRRESALIVERTGGSKFDVLSYKFILYIKEKSRKVLGKINPDLPGKIKHGNKHQAKEK